MAFTKTKLEDIFRGDTVAYRVAIDNGSPTPLPVDITGWTVWLTFKSALGIEDGGAALQVKSLAGDHVDDDPVNGLMYVTITSDDSFTIYPGTYTYDFQRVIEGTNPLDVKTFASGKVKVLEDVTRSTAQDVTPLEFTFIDLTYTAYGIVVESNQITVTSINEDVAISIAGDASSEYSINGAEYTAVAGTVSWGDIIKLRHTTSAVKATQVDSTLTIGSVSDTFSSTTAP